MAKLDIDIVLIDDSVVMHGFRALMSGASIEGFINNPVMLLQHNRPGEYKGRNEIMLPIGKWCDIRVEGNRLLAKPEFDDDDEIAVRVQKKVQKGYLNGASVWIEPFAISEDVADMLPGQSLPTLTKWGMLEASIVDIPNCRNALAIRNNAGKKIMLTGINDEQQAADVDNYLKTFSIKKTTMEKKLLAAKLGLDENIADALLGSKLDAVLADARKLTSVQAENDQLKQANAQMKTAAQQEKINNLVDGAIAANKLAAGDKDRYLKLAKADFETTKELIDAMKPYESIESRLSAAGNGTATEADKARLTELCKLSGVELYNQGLLEELKKLSLPSFVIKYKEAFGSDYKA
jgi:hypothetical protein